MPAGIGRAAPAAGTGGCGGYPAGAADTPVLRGGGSLIATELGLGHGSKHARVRRVVSKDARPRSRRVSMRPLTGMSGLIERSSPSPTPSASKTVAVSRPGILRSAFSADSIAAASIWMMPSKRPASSVRSCSLGRACAANSTSKVVQPGSPMTRCAQSRIASIRAGCPAWRRCREPRRAVRHGPRRAPRYTVHPCCGSSSTPRPWSSRRRRRPSRVTSGGSRRRKIAAGRS